MSKTKLALTLFLSTQLYATDWTRVIGMPPESNSREEEIELDYLLNLQSNRTETDCERIQEDRANSLYQMFGGNHGSLTKRQARRLMPLYIYESARILRQIDLAKKYFNRDRPYSSYNEIEPCFEKAVGKSYPSGHTTHAYYIALVLSERFPKDKEKFMKRAEQIANDRMVAGVHYPSDIEAGRKLAHFIFNQ